MRGRGCGRALGLRAPVGGHGGQPHGLRQRKGTTHNHDLLPTKPKGKPELTQPMRVRKVGGYSGHGLDDGAAPALASAWQHERIHGLVQPWQITLRDMRGQHVHLSRRTDRRRNPMNHQERKQGSCTPTLTLIPEARARGTDVSDSVHLCVSAKGTLQDKRRHGMPKAPHSVFSTLPVRSTPIHLTLL